MSSRSNWDRLQEIEELSSRLNTGRITTIAMSSTCEASMYCGSDEQRGAAFGRFLPVRTQNVTIFYAA